jgi:hypothetical protein
LNDFLKIATEVGQLVEQKNAAYGSSFAKAGDFLRLLYPDGIPPQKYDDALVLVRIFDKQMRIATDRDALGESPYRDILGYGILGAALHESRTNSGEKDGVQTDLSAEGLRQRNQLEEETGEVLLGAVPAERSPGDAEER